MIKFTTRAAVKIVSLLVAAGIVLIGLTVKYYTESRDTKFVLSSVYQKSFSEVAALSQTLLSGMEKLNYAGSTYQFVTLASQIRSSANSAKTALEQLPNADVSLQKTSKLLTVTGDYAYSLSKKLLSNEIISNEELETLKTLTSSLYKVCGALLGTEEQVLDENPTADKISVMFTAAESTANEEEPTGFAKIESDIEALPTLIYDGPFSESNMSKKSVFLEDKDYVSADRARQIAAYAVNVSQAKAEPGGEVNYNGERCFVFNTPMCDVYVTERGGYVRSLACSRVISDAKISFEEAVNKGKGYMEKIGYKNMKETYYYEDSNILTVNYACMQGDVMCYTDLIKVGIALDNGEIVFLDASTYLTNHTITRSYLSTVSEEDAKKLVSESSAITSVKKALIPSEGGNELYCYEFSVGNENNALIYINAQTGREEKILILLKSDNGTLVF